MGRQPQETGHDLSRVERRDDAEVAGGAALAALAVASKIRVKGSCSSPDAKMHEIAGGDYLRSSKANQGLVCYLKRL